VESAYLTLAVGAGLDFVLGIRRRTCICWSAMIRSFAGSRRRWRRRPSDGETQEEAGFRQAHKIIELFNARED
jgi:hypothetical protein